MKSPKPPKGYASGTLSDPAFRYRPSYDTDIRRTFARAQRALVRKAPAAQADMFSRQAQAT